MKVCLLKKYSRKTLFIGFNHLNLRIADFRFSVASSRFRLTSAISMAENSDAGLGVPKTGNIRSPKSLFRYFSMSSFKYSFPSFVSFNGPKAMIISYNFLSIAICLQPVKPEEEIIDGQNFHLVKTRFTGVFAQGVRSHDGAGSC